ncbi:MAG: rod shape-determining protein MreC [Acidimicrobiales bacterium]
MASSRRTGRSRLTLALLILTSLALLTLDFRDSTIISAARRGASSAFSPLRGVAETATGPFTNAWHGITGYGDLQDENDALRAEIDRLRGTAAQDEDAASQLAGLLNQLDIEWVGDIPTATARVVAGPLSNFSHTIEIDKGSNSGFKVGMPVINGAGLVGRLVQVTADDATVQLITDPDFAVGVRLVPSGAPGTARGTGAGANLIVDTGLESDASVARGATLTTSGADRSAFPGFIPVGKVVRTRSGGGGLTLDLVVRPLADTEKLAFVSVMLWPVAP